VKKNPKCNFISELFLLDCSEIKLERPLLRSPASQMLVSREKLKAKRITVRELKDVLSDFFHDRIIWTMKSMFIL